MAKKLLLRLCGKTATVSKKARRGKFPRRALIDLTGLEFKTQIRLEYLILIHRIDTDVVPNSAGAD